MRMSNLIRVLQEAQGKWGDLKVTTWDGDVKMVLTHPCRDGIQSTTDGVQDTEGLNEISLELICG